jgi:LPS export ABC transporter permease LptF/LPS export ABC transporter permease LptG
MRILDRYIIREILLPFAIALVVLSFVLIIPFIIELAEQLIQKGVSGPTILQLMVTLLPATLGLTIPMALLIAVLIAFGRLSGDREIVVLMACGVSPYRLLRPVLGLAAVAAAATLWVMIEAIPNANQTHREITTRIVADRAEGEVRPRVFFEDFPNTVLYVREVPQTGGWQDVVAADTRNAAQPILYVAKRGRMVVNRDARTIQMVLEDGAQHTTKSADPAGYEIARFKELVLSLDPESVFPRVGPARGERELTIPELQELRAMLEARNLPFHRPVIEIHKKFSIPTACLVFGLLAVGLGVTNRKDGKLASFVLGLAVIFAYYVIMFGAEAMAKGALIPAWSAMWIPNVLLGGLGIALLLARARGVDSAMRVSLPAWRWPFRQRAEENSGVEPAPRRLAYPAATPARRGVVVVIRIPQFELPRPQLLDLYVARTYGRMLVMCIVGIMGLFYISTFLDKSDKLFKGEVTLGMLLQYLWWETPQFLYYIIAIAVLLSAIITVGLLTKNSELIVMRACGISLYRTALPLVVFAAIASGVLFAFEERVLAFSNRRADYLNHIIRGGDSQTFDVVNRQWLVGANGEIYHYQFFDPRRRELNALSILRFTPDTLELKERVFATQAVYSPRGPGDAEPWVATGGWSRDLAGTAVTRYSRFESARLSLEPADYFETEAPEPDRMNFVELRRHIEELQTSGYNVTEYEVALQRKFAFPLVTLVMTLIAVPFAVTTGKRGAMYGIGVGIVLALVYWTAISVFAAFGASGLMSPTLAAWAPNLLFGASAAYLLLTVRT